MAIMPKFKPGQLVEYFVNDDCTMLGLVKTTRAAPRRGSPVGGGVPKNFIQDTVICAELLGKNVDMHKYAIQITVADSRDGACSSSTLKEASSWGKVDTTKEQMVFAEATSVLPLIASDAYHAGKWKNRNRKNFSKIFD